MRGLSTYEMGSETRSPNKRFLFSLVSARNFGHNKSKITNTADRCRSRRPLLRLNIVMGFLGIANWCVQRVSAKEALQNKRQS